MPESPAALAERPGKAFEQRVEDAYRALGYQVTPNTQLPGGQADLIARRQIEGGPAITLAIECKDHQDPVGNMLVHDFCNVVSTHCRRLLISGGVMVSASGFTSDARAAAADHPDVTLLSWEELTSQILDVRHQLEERVDNYENSSIFHNYLPLQIELLSWSTLSPEESDPPELDELLGGWMGSSPAGRHLTSLFVLADFGSGKTTLLRNLEYDRAKAHLAGEDLRVPLFVPLREFRESQDITVLLRASFRETYLRDPPAELLWRRIHDGQFYVLLDGFDEMVERSDVAVRVELFRALLDILRSPSPSIVTSRPSYFVEHGELEGLLATLRDYETDLSGPIWAAKGDRSAAVTRIRRRLVDEHRERRPESRENDPLSLRENQVLRLLPMDDEQIAQFVGLRSKDLERANTSPETFMEFIRDVYDLEDLARRPLLLTMIITTVVKGDIDPADTATRYGPSGIYEIHTGAALEIDLAKGQTRRGGLSADERRKLAEGVAIEMYRASTLEVDFAATIGVLIEQLGRVPEETASTRGLSEQQIATDFATCSFVTLDRNGKCRFIHKSFRGFFVARVIKSRLPKLHPLLSQELEREVLYFLGGFAPTEPSVGERLWASFLKAEKDATTLRRNLLVAFLYTKPDHDTRRISEAKIGDAEFSRLNFEGTRLKEVEWQDCTVMKLHLRKAKWNNVRFVDSHIGSFCASETTLDVLMRDTVVESLELDRTGGEIFLSESPVHFCSIRDASIHLGLGSSELRRMEVARSWVNCEALSGDGRLSELNIADSRIRVGKHCTAKAKATRSALTLHGEQEQLIEWELTECVLALIYPPSSARHGSLPLEAELKVDEGSIVHVPTGISHTLLQAIRCGVFGAVPPNLGRAPNQKRPSGWGILHMESAGLGEMKLPSGVPGCRWGRFLVVTKKWYEQETGKDGCISALPVLDRLREKAASANADMNVGDRVAELLASVKAQYDDVMRKDWPELDIRS